MLFLPWLVVAAAATLLFLSAWIVVPGWTYSLLTLAVGAPELSAWLLLASIGVGVMALTIASSGSRLPQLALVMAVAAAALTSMPLLRVPATIRQFDAEMQRAFGSDLLNGVPAVAREHMRTRPLVVVDLFRGVSVGEAEVRRGVPVGVADGQPLTLTVYRPTSAGRFPIVVQIYGGAWQRGSPDDNPEFARYLAARGYVVFAIDYRHAPRWPWPAQMDDVRAAFAWIRMHAGDYNGDASRVAVIGRSAGAHLALLAAYDPTMPPVRSVVSYYGPVDLAEGYRTPPTPDPLDVRAIDEAFLSGTPDTAADRYRAASPITYVTRPLPPTLLVYGRRDHIVEARFGRMLYQRLLATNTRAAYLEIPWAEHAFDALPSGLSAQIALFYTERFLASTLLR